VGKSFGGVVFNAFHQVIKDGFKQEMDIAESIVSSKNLRVGMILVQDLITPGGLLLLSSGLEMSAQLIEKIRAFEADQSDVLKIYISLKGLE
jgi:hypothetical protein